MGDHLDACVLAPCPRGQVFRKARRRRDTHTHVNSLLCTRHPVPKPGRAHGSPGSLSQLWMPAHPWLLCTVLGVASRPVSVWWPRRHHTQPASFTRPVVDAPTASRRKFCVITLYRGGRQGSGLSNLVPALVRTELDTGWSPPSVEQAGQGGPWALTDPAPLPPDLHAPALL